MSLLDLPLDLLYEIASHIDHDRDLDALAHTCSSLYTVFNFELYRRDAKQSQSRALFWAVRQNQSSTLRKSLEAGASAPWSTLLCLAAENESVAAMKVLLAHDGVDIKAVEQSGVVPLLAKAVMDRSPKVVRFLLTRNEVDPNIKDYQERTPLAYAASECFNDVVKVLLKCPRVDVNCTDNAGCTPLHLTSGKSHVYVVRTLLSNRLVDVDARDSVHIRTALSAAVESLWRQTAWRPEKVPLKYLRTVEAFLDHPATSVDYDMEPDLVQLYRFSAQYGYEGIFRLLRSKAEGQLPGELDHSGSEILFFVAKHGQAGIMKLLFADGFEPEAQTEMGRTTLSIAAEHKQIEIIQLLLSTGKVDVNSKDPKGRTPLWWAMTHGWRQTGTDETVKLLLAHDATIPTIGDKKQLLKTLQKALEHGNCFLSEMLLDQMEEYMPATWKTRQLLLSAVAKSENISLAKTLLERAEIDLNARNYNGYTVLDRAIFCADLPPVDLLLVLDGIDLNSGDWNDDTALAIAIKELRNSVEERNFYEACVEKLLRHEGVSTASLDPDWLIDSMIAYLVDGGDQKLMKLLILKDDLIRSDSIIHGSNAGTLLNWAQQSGHRTVVRALLEKERRLRMTNEADAAPC